MPGSRRGEIALLVPRGPLNARGYCDLERAVPKTEGVRRAVFIGDSLAVDRTPAGASRP